jgi:Cobalamin-independent synthase, N-terminal domain
MNHGILIEKYQVPYFVLELNYEIYLIEKCNLRIITQILISFFLVKMTIFFFIICLQLGIDTIPVLIGPVTYLLFSKPAKDVEKSFCTLLLLESILPIYK